MNNQELINQAKQVAKNAYAPYSKFKVGACVLYESKKIYTGCNIENASYSLCLCAERNAISTAIAQGEKSKIKAIAIASLNNDKCYPCGACREWLREFCEDAQVVIEEDSQIKCYSSKELLPYSTNYDFS